MYIHLNPSGKGLINTVPLSQAKSIDWKNIKLIATDMDGTLTSKGKFTNQLLQALENLATANIKVLIVTGRSAGWVSGISSLMPVVGAIAENGGLFYQAGSDRPIPLTPISDLASHRQQLAAAFRELQTKFPQIQESADNGFRITDWTFDVAGLTANEIQTLSHLCHDMEWGFTYSNVQCHIKPQTQDKATGLLQILQQYWPEYSLEQVVTVGDSPNDESLFNRDYFSLSFGVANVLVYIQQLKHQPAYVTHEAEGEGFCELSNYILQSVN